MDFGAFPILRPKLSLEFKMHYWGQSFRIDILEVSVIRPIGNLAKPNRQSKPRSRHKFPDKKKRGYEGLLDTHQINQPCTIGVSPFGLIF